jgi:hypothetical protein
VGAFGPGNGFDGPFNLSIVQPLQQGGGNMNRLAGLNLRYQSLRSTIRQEQIQLTHLRKHDSRLFTRGGAGATSANNAGPNAIKAGWPIVPIAKNMGLGGRKLHIRCHAGITSRPKTAASVRHFARQDWQRFFGAIQANSGNLSRPIANNQAIQAISRSQTFQNT